MFRVKPEGRHPVQDGVDDLIHDEGEELQDGAEDVVPRLEREAAFRQAAPKDDMTPEELEKFVKERYQDRAADLDVGRDAATSGVAPSSLSMEWRCICSCKTCTPCVTIPSSRMQALWGSRNLLQQHADLSLSRVCMLWASNTLCSEQI